MARLISFFMRFTSSGLAKNDLRGFVKHTDQALAGGFDFIMHCFADGFITSKVGDFSHKDVVESQFSIGQT
ncbi:MAG: hypothetical protein PHR66_08550 [Desulfuromonadaceae bacterium]|nr:hypothetical protein [Desulfuromonadaceae bacterium]